MDKGRGHDTRKKEVASPTEFQENRFTSKRGFPELNANAIFPPYARHRPHGWRENRESSFQILGCVLLRNLRPPWRRFPDERQVARLNRGTARCAHANGRVRPDAASRYGAGRPGRTEADPKRACYYF